MKYADKWGYDRKRQQSSSPHSFTTNQQRKTRYEELVLREHFIKNTRTPEFYFHRRGPHTSPHETALQTRASIGIRIQTVWISNQDSRFGSLIRIQTVWIFVADAKACQCHYTTSLVKRNRNFLTTTLQESMNQRTRNNIAHIN